MMATGMIKRGSGSAYTRLIRKGRARQIRALADWEVVRDILYRAQLSHNDPKDFCPGEKFERVSKQIAKAITRPQRETP